MKLLAIETSTDVCAAAVCDEDNVIGESRLSLPHAHSEQLMNLIGDVLAKANLDVKRIDAIAISIGPGSFTGLRIGLSVAKGLAYAIDKPLVTVHTLEALAVHALRQGLAREGDLILPLIDARRNEVYAATYRCNTRLATPVEPVRAMIVDDLSGLMSVGERVIVMGDGIGKFQKAFIEPHPEFLPWIVVPTPEQYRCNAGAVGLIGVRKLQHGELADLASLEPLYVKEFATTMKPQQMVP